MEATETPESDSDDDAVSGCSDGAGEEKEDTEARVRTIVNSLDVLSSACAIGLRAFVCDSSAQCLVISGCIHG